MQDSRAKISGSKIGNSNDMGRNRGMTRAGIRRQCRRFGGRRTCQNVLSCRRQGEPVVSGFLSPRLFGLSKLSRRAHLYDSVQPQRGGTGTPHVGTLLGQPIQTQLIARATLEFSHGLVVKGPEGLVGMCECPRHGCEPADVCGIVDRPLLCRTPGMKRADESGTDGKRNPWKVLVCDKPTDSVNQRGLFWRR
jgi:hypothetical protein